MTGRTWIEAAAPVTTSERVILVALLDEYEKRDGSLEQARRTAARCGVSAQRVCDIQDNHLGPFRDADWGAAAVALRQFLDGTTA